MDKNVKDDINSFLIFKIGDEQYGANVKEVLNILELTPITKLPKAPEYLKGVIDLRGMVLPVIDTRVKLKMSPTDFTDNTCIIVLDLNTDEEIIHVGALVDSVVAVLEINSSVIEPAPALGNVYKSEFIKGVAKINEDFIMILDLVKLFTKDELETLKNQKK